MFIGFLFIIFSLLTIQYFFCLFMRKIMSSCTVAWQNLQLTILSFYFVCLFSLSFSLSLVTETFIHSHFLCCFIFSSFLPPAFPLPACDIYAKCSQVEDVGFSRDFSRCLLCSDSWMCPWGLTSGVFPADSHMIYIEGSSSYILHIQPININELQSIFLGKRHRSISSF